MKKRVKKRIKVKRWIGWPFIIATIGIAILSVFSVYQLDILPTKYFILIIMGEILGVIFVFFLLESKHLVLFSIGLLLMIVMDAGNIALSHYTAKTNRFINKTFAEYIITTTDYIVITSKYNEKNTMEEIDSTQNIHYFKYSRSIDLAQKKLGNFQYEPADSIANVLSILQI